MSLRARLLLATLVAAFLGLALVDVLTYTLLTRAQLNEVDQELERAHPPIERAADEGDDPPVPAHRLPEVDDAGDIHMGDEGELEFRQGTCLPSR